MNRLSVRKSLYGLCAAVIFAVVAPCAYATIIDGTLNFTVTNGSPAPTGSFVWNSSTSTWNDLTVDWDGAVFNFAPLIPNLGLLAGGGTWCAAGPANVTSSCALPANLELIQSTIQTIPEQPTFTDGDAGANGAFTVAQTVAAPEPGSLGMMLVGLGALVFFWVRRRNSLSRRLLGSHQL